MKGTASRVLDLWEHRPCRFTREELKDEEVEILWREHRDRIAIELPSFKTGGRWELTSLGWVGFLPVTGDLGLRLHPKVELLNLFRMLEVAYRLKSFQLFHGLIDCRSLEEVYERLAHILARRVLDRGRKGYAREYVPHRDRLAFVRGRLDLARTLRAPWEVRLDCRFQEHTSDIGDNQILAWTLERIARSAACRRTEVLSSVRQAFRNLLGVATPVPIGPEACEGRLYTRLSEDYRPLHALCRFFLSHTGPSHEPGGDRNLPFLVDMSRLFEMFVAEWLRDRLASQGLELRIQERLPIGPGLSFQIDLVVYDREQARALCVLDTKYKAPDSPAAADIAQVVAYAEAKGCREAALVYPVPLRPPIEARVGDIRIRSLAFELHGDLEENGCTFLGDLLGHAPLHGPPPPPHRPLGAPGP